MTRAAIGNRRFTLAVAGVVLVLMACDSGDRAAQKGELPEELETSGKSDWTSTFAGGVRAKVLKVRSYQPPASKFKLLEDVPDDSYYYLQMDEVSLGGGPSVLLAAVGQEDGRRLIQTDTKFSRRCVELQPPKGRWLEALVLFENQGKSEVHHSLSSSQKGRLAVELVPKDNSNAVAAVDFLAAGLSNSDFDHLKELEGKDLTVVSEFDGDVQLFLEPGGKTWMIFLFDIPSPMRSAGLAIAGASPIQLSW